MAWNAATFEERSQNVAKKGLVSYSSAEVEQQISSPRLEAFRSKDQMVEDERLGTGHRLKASEL